MDSDQRNFGVRASLQGLPVCRFENDSAGATGGHWPYRQLAPRRHHDTKRTADTRCPLQVQAMAALSGYTRPAGSATYITQTLRAGTVQEHAGTVVIFGYDAHMLDG